MPCGARNARAITPCQRARRPGGVERGSGTGTSADGYTVRSGLTGQAKELDGAGDDAGTIRGAVAPALCYPDDTLGGPDAGAAAWEAEARTLEDALHELADKVRLSKGAYAGSDGLVDTSVRSVPAGPAGTTMPTPAGPDHVTTLPTRAEHPSALSGY
ncbi:hypothetical protein [Streptomyces sp. LaPpAH-108]|uniref:hypothetical protein n=1 Tax=Streptomyces sp. LaPpAH-108 TaxID=1155714 RepID=UPI000375C8D7|nr:hypothetical protein [Streptomyces sp. LaPpAH-108]